jgi:sphinganine C4-monooxygenase
MRDLGNIHSVHHHLYNPYSWGTLYNHPLEGFYLDTVGAYVGKSAAGLSHREATFFFTLATVKGTSDHCGYDLPWDPIRIFGYLTGNGLYFHNVHHQSWGLKVSESGPACVAANGVI